MQHPDEGEREHLTQVEREYLEARVAEMRDQALPELVITMWAKGYSDSKRTSTMTRYERELYPTRRDAQNA